jgi:hypothetical protein
LNSADWDALRAKFQGSMMLETSLAALAENIDGCAWPRRDAEEKPSAYIGLDHDAVLARLHSRGLMPAHLDQLAEILRGTLVFDESFGEMVDVAAKAETDLDPVTRNLARLGIPEDFPISLCTLRPGTVDFCQRENLTTLSEFLAFARGASRQVIIGGEFRELLNALIHVDEQTIASFLPFRPKATGLYFIEGLALLVRELSDEKRHELVLRPHTLDPDARSRGWRLAEHFKAQLDDMRAALAGGTAISRLVAPLNNLAIEPVVASVLRLYLTPDAYPEPSATPATQEPAPKKGGLLSWLSGLFR